MAFVASFQGTAESEHVDFLILIFIVGGSFFILWLLDRRAKQKGSLFSGPATPVSKISALILGLIAAAVFISNLIDGIFSFEFLILAVALIGYFLGFRRLLDFVQHNESPGSKVYPVTAVTLDNERGTTIVEPGIAQIREMVLDFHRDGDSAIIKSPSGSYVRATLKKDDGFVLEHREAHPDNFLLVNEYFLSTEETMIAFTEFVNDESGFKSRYRWNRKT